LIPAQTEAALRLARALINTSHLPVLLFNGDLEIVGASNSFCATFDVAHDKTIGVSLAKLGGGEWAIPQLRLLLENALLNGPEMGDYETDLTRPGVPPRRLQVNVQNVVHADSQNTRVLMAVNDVTHARHAERMNVTLLLEKDHLLRERAILLQEMQHRVANSLQIIASILLLKARAVTSAETRLHLHDAHNRVMSLAAVQQHLSFSIGDVELEPYLTKLCDSLVASMIRDSRHVTLRVEVQKQTIGSQEAVSLGLIVTELVINALKYAFPDGRSGQIVVAYEVAPSGWALSVTDSGVGRSISPGAKASLGTSIVEGLAKQLGAEVLISDAGPGARITIASVAGSSLAAALNALPQAIAVESPI
jgi:two-component sensor histidine kinase